MRNSAGVVLKTFVYGARIDEPIMMKQGATAYYYTQDGLGSVSEITNSAGAIVESYIYDPFGAVTILDAVGSQISSSTIGNPYFFTGREWDSETGLYYYRARYYDPTLGRFLETDPIGYVDSMGLYVYVGNNPWNWVDPFGKDIALDVDPNGAGGNGHTSLYYQDSSGGWNKYDQGAAGDTSSGQGDTGLLFGLDAPAGVSINEVDGPPAGSVRLPTNSSQDALIAQSALQSQQNHNSGKSDYNLYMNNCTDACVDVVNNSGAGLNIPNPWYVVAPNTWYEKLKEWYKENSQNKK